MKKQIFQNALVKKATMNSLLGGVTDPNEDDDFTRDKKNPITPAPSQPSTPPQPGTAEPMTAGNSETATY